MRNFAGLLAVGNGLLFLFCSIASAIQLKTLQINSTDSQSSQTLTYTASEKEYYFTVIVDQGVDFLQKNICHLKTIFGRTGSGNCGLNYQSFPSNVYRTLGTSQITLAQETGSYAQSSLPSNYSEVSKVDLDPVVTRFSTAQRAVIQDCGINRTSIAEKIADCATVNGSNATWDGVANGNSGEVVWKIVTHSGGTGSNKEVWQDQRTKLLWSRPATNLTWCQAAGNTQNAGGVDCSSNTISACAELNGMSSAPDFTVDGTTVETPVTGPYAREKGGLGLASTPQVYWSLPSRNEYAIAASDGLSSVVNASSAWTSTIYSADRSQAMSFSFAFYYTRNLPRTSTISALCVGRATE